MCGFFFTNNKSKCSDWNFEDILQRGFSHEEFFHNDVYAIQSVLPCVNETVDFSLFNTTDYIFLYTGEIYNYNRSKFKNDTEQVLYDILNKNSNIHYNGMYAYVFYDKKSKEVIYRRDKTGQVPLFIYEKNNHLIISTTIKSIVKTIKALPNKQSLELWKTSKHFIFNDTPWQDIYAVIPCSNELYYYNSNIKDIFKKLKPDYYTYLKSASINSGGIDSGIVSKWFGEFSVAINHVTKDYISNKLDFAFNVCEKEWVQYVDEFIEKTYLFPYTWSWVGYYILGKKLKDKVNVLYTGEGADEIFGGYPDYEAGIRTPYSKPFPIDENNLLVSNKLLDQKYFIPISAMGANLALGCFTIEPRSPFLDRRILNNKSFIYENNKKTLKIYYEELYGCLPPPKQGFAGFPDEYGRKKTWKDACFEKILNIARLS